MRNLLASDTLLRGETMKGFFVATIVALCFFTPQSCPGQSLWDVKPAKKEEAAKVKKKQKKEKLVHPSRIFTFQQLHPEIAEASKSLQMIEEEKNWYRLKRYEARDGIAATRKNGRPILLFCYNGSPCGRT